MTTLILFTYEVTSGLRLPRKTTTVLLTTGSLFFVFLQKESSPAFFTIPAKNGHRSLRIPSRTEIQAGTRFSGPLLQSKKRAIRLTT